MLDHVSLGTHDFDRASDFYTRLLAVIGYRVQRRDETQAAFGPDADWLLFLLPAADDEPVIGTRMHVAFRVADRASALAFQQAALALGAQQLREVAERPQFGADYFGGVFQDLDGHAIEVLTRAR